MNCNFKFLLTLTIRCCIKGKKKEGIAYVHGSKWLVQRYPDALNHLNPKSEFQIPVPLGATCTLKDKCPIEKGGHLCAPSASIPGGGSSLVCLPPLIFKTIWISFVKSPYFKMLVT